jgi:DNA-binding MarR family transcriptional regulator
VVSQERSAPEVARELGISLPTLHRAASSLPGVQRDSRRRLRIGSAALVELRGRFGVLPRLEGLTRAQVQVLAALSRHPRGMVSAREVAKAARLSPTATSRALRVLEHQSLVTRLPTVLFDGRVRRRQVFAVNWHCPGWLAVAPIIGRVSLPEARRELRSGPRLPSRLAADFWTGEWRSIDVLDNPVAVARRILNEASYDPEAIAYLGFLPEGAVRRALAEQPPIPLGRGIA